MTARGLGLLLGLTTLAALPWLARASEEAPGETQTNAPREQVAGQKESEQTAATPEKAAARAKPVFELSLAADLQTTDAAGRVVILKVTCPDLKQLPDGNPLLLLDVPGQERQQILLSPVMDGVWANRLITPEAGTAKASVLAIKAGEKGHQFEAATWQVDLKSLRLKEEIHAEAPEALRAKGGPKGVTPAGAEVVVKAEERSWILIAVMVLLGNLAGALLVGLAFVGFTRAPQRWIAAVRTARRAKPAAPAAAETAAAKPPAAPEPVAAPAVDATVADPPAASPAPLPETPAAIDELTDEDDGAGLAAIPAAGLAATPISEEKTIAIEPEPEPAPAAEPEPEPAPAAEPEPEPAAAAAAADEPESLATPAPEPEPIATVEPEPAAAALPPGPDEPINEDFGISTKGMSEEDIERMMMEAMGGGPGEPTEISPPTADAPPPVIEQDAADLIIEQLRAQLNLASEPAPANPPLPEPEPLIPAANLAKLESEMKASLEVARELRATPAPAPPAELPDPTAGDTRAREKKAAESALAEPIMVKNADPDVLDLDDLSF